MKVRKKDTSSKITSKGQTTIPIEIRERLGAQKGDELKFTIHEDGSVTVEKVVVETSRIEELIQELVGVGVNEGNVEGVIQNIRQHVSKNTSK